MRCAMFCVYDDNFKELANLTWDQNRKLYAERWGYDTFVKNSDFNRMQIGFAKIKFMLEVMERKEHDIVYWSGTDTMITNFFIPLTEFVYDGYHITMAKDFSGGMNNDSMLVRNTEEGRAWMKMIIDNMPAYLTDHRFEAGPMWDTYDQFKNIIKILPQRMFNAYHYPLYVNKGARSTLDGSGFSGQWYPGDFLFHACDQTMEVRMDICTQVMKYVLK